MFVRERERDKRNKKRGFFETIRDVVRFVLSSNVNEDSCNSSVRFCLVSLLVCHCFYLLLFLAMLSKKDIPHQSISRCHENVLMSSYVYKSSEQII